MRGARPARVKSCTGANHLPSMTRVCSTGDLRGTELPGGRRPETGTPSSGERMSARELAGVERLAGHYRSRWIAALDITTNLSPLPSNG